MTQLTQVVFNQITQLPEQDQGALLQMLIEREASKTHVNLSPEWEQEIDQRIALIKAGKNKLIPWREALARSKA